jgi:hypothetical protein
MIKKTCGNCRYLFSMNDTPMQKRASSDNKIHKTYRPNICVNYHNSHVTDSGILDYCRLEFPILDKPYQECRDWRKRS